MPRAFVAADDSMYAYVRLADVQERERQRKEEQERRTQQAADVEPQDSWAVRDIERRHQERLARQQAEDAQRERIRQAEINATAQRVLREKESAEKQRQLAIDIAFDSMNATDVERRKVTALIKQIFPQSVNDPNAYLSVLVKLRNGGSDRPRGVMPYGN